MAGMLDLNGMWDVTWVEGSSRMDPGGYVGTDLQGHPVLPATVPGPVHAMLLERGLIRDPNLGLNSLSARWVEEMFWIYRRTVDVPAGAADGASAWLVCDRIECAAVVYLNGKEVGRHTNAHRPARIDLTGKLQAGTNVLAIRVEAGLHDAVNRPVDFTHAGLTGMLTRRAWLRKPQYQSGWDWHPRLMNVGLLGDVRLEWSHGPLITQTSAFAVADGDLAAATVTARAVVWNPGDEPRAVSLAARIEETGAEAAATVDVPAGESVVEVRLPLQKPDLWWPVGLGKQHRYTVSLEADAGDAVRAGVHRVGVRKVEMDQSPHPVTGRYCTLRINDRPVFCKGGNWVPPDIFYSAVEPERYRALVDLALGANFNMLRIWGGGEYVPHALLEACDETGLLVWHDYAYACAQYPGTDPVFLEEIRHETRWVVRERAHHPSLVVWCGSNEIEQGDWEWGYDRASQAHPHYTIFHHELPKITLEENPSALHWLSSPWSPDYKTPNDPTVGDQHPWAISLGQPDASDFFDYRERVDRFPNEGGVLGASSVATLKQFLPAGEQRLFSPTWEHHDNPFAVQSQDPNIVGRVYGTVRLHCGLDARELSVEDHAFFSGLLQGEGLREYIDNYRRRMYSSASAIFWMYNDSWPVTHGWTIVDYYLRRKLAYHPVRRAFQTVSVVVAEDGGEVVVFGVNEGREAWRGRLRCGFVRLDGGYPEEEQHEVELAPNRSAALARFPRTQWDGLGTRETAAFAVLYDDEGRVHAQNRLFVERFKDLAFEEPAVELRRRDGAVELVAPVFCWGVCLDLEGDRPVADNAFDLLPGIPYRVAWKGGALGDPQVVQTGSGALRRLQQA